MHLYVIRLPQMQSVLHLHPERTGPAVFTQALLRWRQAATPFMAMWCMRRVLRKPPPAKSNCPPWTARRSRVMMLKEAVRPSRYRRISAARRLRSTAVCAWFGTATSSRCTHAGRIPFASGSEAAGQPARDIELYMGMLGHAAFVSHDGSVFAHVHPFGSVAMPALKLAQPAHPNGSDTQPANPHAALAQPAIQRPPRKPKNLRNAKTRPAIRHAPLPPPQPPRRPLPRQVTAYRPKFRFRMVFPSPADTASWCR